MKIDYIGDFPLRKINYKCDVILSLFLKFIFDLMVCGKGTDNEPLKEFILQSPAPIDTAVKLSSLYRDMSEKEKVSYELFYCHWNDEEKQHFSICIHLDDANFVDLEYNDNCKIPLYYCTLLIIELKILIYALISYTAL